MTLGYEAHDAAQAAFLRGNVQVFAQAKTAHETQALTALLLDEQGRVKSWEVFREQALALHEQYNVRWLQAEYEHAVASAQMAARWQEFQPDDMLQYHTVGDGRVRPEHAAWEGITRLASDEWWLVHWPPNGWLCRCTATVAAPGARQTPKQVLGALPDPDPLFHNNVGVSGIIFPEGHPYFEALSAEQRVSAPDRSRSVLSGFKYGRTGPAHQLTGIRTALNSIDQVHELPPALRGEVPTPIKFKKLDRDTRGEFDFTDSQDLRILLSPSLGDRSQVAATLLHEIGHYLDYTALEPAGQLTRFAEGSDLVLVLDAARKTRVVQGYEQLSRNPSALVFDTSYAEYLSRPEELWVRAYAQYIAEQSGDDRLVQVFTDRAALPIPTQWPVEDFAPIREAIDRLFVHKGWKSPRE